MTAYERYEEAQRNCAHWEIGAESFENPCGIQTNGTEYSCCRELEAAYNTYRRERKHTPRASGKKGG